RRRHTRFSRDWSSDVCSSDLGPRDRALVELLIDDLDDDGFRESSLDEILAIIPPEAGVEPEELQAALRLLQSFDPPGVGAADLRSEERRVGQEGRARWSPRAE